MGGSGASAGLGLISAVSWGGSDFVGGLGARRAPALLVVVSGQILSLATLVALCLELRVPAPDRHYLIYAIVGGFEGSLALAAFYQALAMGAMGLTAALTGLLTALVPVVFSLWHEGLPDPLNLAGLAAGCAAIWLITHQRASRTSASPPKALLLGALAGAAFGSQLILLKLAGGGGILWALTCTRAAGVTALLLVLLAARPFAALRALYSKRAPASDRATSSPRPRRSFLWIALLAGTLDTCGNLFYLRSALAGRLAVAALVASLYPGVTILLAALVLREYPTRRQIAGMALALAAVVMLSA
ncbi:MAG: EamA family transporter [Terracidiphilus sp.]